MLSKFNRRKNLFLRNIKTKFIKYIFDKKNKACFDRNKIKHILFLRDDDKLGDMIVSTISFKAAKKSGFTVSVIAGPTTEKIINNNKYVDNIFVYKKGYLNACKISHEINLLDNKINLIIDVGDELRPETLLLLSLIKNKFLLGFNKKNYMLYDISLIDNPKDAHHVTFRHKKAMEFLGVNLVDENYHINVPETIEKEVSLFLNNIGENILIINPFAASSHRCLSKRQMKEISTYIHNKYCGMKIIIIGSQDKIKNLKIDYAITSPFNTFFHSVALIKNSDFILSPDTSIVHVCQAFNKPLLALYRKDPINEEKINSKIWGPNNKNALILFTTEECGDISSIKSESILKTFNLLIKNHENIHN